MRCAKKQHDLFRLHIMIREKQKKIHKNDIQI